MGKEDAGVDLRFADRPRGARSGHPRAEHISFFFTLTAFKLLPVEPQTKLQDGSVPWVANGKGPTDVARQRSHVDLKRRVPGD